MENQVNVAVLNDLIQINYDRIAGYERAIENITDDEIGGRTIQRCKDYIGHSEKFINQLSDVVTKHGGTPADSATIAGALHRTWMDIKDTFTFSDKENALESCIFGDKAAMEVYEAALTNADNYFDDQTRATLQEQHQAISMAHAKNTAKEEKLEDDKYEAITK